MFDLFRPSLNVWINLKLSSGKKRNFSLDLTIPASSEYNESDHCFAFRWINVGSEPRCVYRHVYNLVQLVLGFVQAHLKPWVQIEWGCAIENLCCVGSMDHEHSNGQDWLRDTRFTVQHCLQWGAIYIAFIHVYKQVQMNHTRSLKLLCFCLRPNPKHLLFVVQVERFSHFILCPIYWFTLCNGSCKQILSSWQKCIFTWPTILKRKLFPAWFSHYAMLLRNETY